MALIALLIGLAALVIMGALAQVYGVDSRYFGAQINDYGNGRGI